MSDTDSSDECDFRPQVARARVEAPGEPVPMAAVAAPQVGPSVFGAPARRTEAQHRTLCDKMRTRKLVRALQLTVSQQEEQ